MQKVKIGLAAVAAILVVIIILQNTDAVETRLLFLTMTMPRAVLLLLTMLIGFALGLVSALGWIGRKKTGKS